MKFNMKTQTWFRLLALFSLNLFLLSGCASNNITRESILLSQPVEGSIVKSYGQSGSKGLDFSTQAGALVRAAAAGTVVYAGSGLQGYGTMVIVKHGNTFLTAYAHTNELLVQQNAFVQSGQPIAKMGSSGTGQVKLYFELRQGGKAIDPQPYLQQGTTK